MAKLNENWLTQGLIDAEYKRYMLLAYLQEVKANFDARRLYPFLSDLVFHYNNLRQLKEHKQLIYRHFPKEITKADFEKLKLSYRQIVGDDQLMKIIEDIIGFSLPQFKSYLDTGAEIYEEIACQIVIEPIGICPLFNQQGYVMVCAFQCQEVHIYRYNMAVFNHSEDNYRALNMEHLEVTQRSLSNTYENIKSQLIRRYPWPNPATFLAYSKLTYPLHETLLPITKRLLMQHLEKAA